jgi:hypothetical protein
VEVFYERTAGGALKRRLLYYPEYYHTMLSRLYVQGGLTGPSTPTAFVAVYVEETTWFGARRKVLTSLDAASSYAEATRAAANVRDGHARVVGLTPFRPCVSLDPLTVLVSVHDSPTIDTRAPMPQGGTAGQPPLVRIFEYRPRAALRDASSESREESLSLTADDVRASVDTQNRQLIDTAKPAIN